MGLFEEVLDDLEDLLEEIFEPLTGERAKKRRRRDVLASKTGLRRDRDGVYRGAYRDVGVALYERNRGTLQVRDIWVYVVAGLAVALPQGTLVKRRPKGLFSVFAGDGVDLGVPVDPRLVCATGHPAELAPLLADREVAGRMVRILDSGGQFTAEHGRVKLARRGGISRHGVALLDEATKLVRAMERAMRLPWRRVQQRRRLTRTHDEGVTELSGDVGGLRLTIRAQPGACEIEVGIHPSLPVGTRVTAGEGQGHPLGDQILDSMLRVEAGDPAALGARLCRDAVRGPLLEVLHGHPGSELRGDRLVMRLDYRPCFELEAKVDLVIELALALR